MEIENTSGVTPEEWDNIRGRFRHSLMVKTELYKLGQNIDVAWPLRGKDEIPLKYLPLTLDELLLVPGIAENPSRIRTLVDIFAETLAFDDPFGEMAEHVDSSSKKDESAYKVMQELKIPAEFPIALCRISPETRQFCDSEGLETIGAFLEFTQTMAQSVVVGGDFRAFLNGFVHKDERAIATFLPLRPGREGLHLPEALGHLVENLSKEEYLHFLETFGGQPTADDRKGVAKLTPEQVAAAEASVVERCEKVFEWFSDQTDVLRDRLVEGGSSLERYFMHLENPNKETVAIGLSRMTLEPKEVEEEKPKGLFARLAALFGR
jgi:hypothetical protein